jgi:hypothetical protein
MGCPRHLARRSRKCAELEVGGPCLSGSDAGMRSNGRSQASSLHRALSKPIFLWLIDARQKRADLAVRWRSRAMSNLEALSLWRTPGRTAGHLGLSKRMVR